MFTDTPTEATPDGTVFDGGDLPILIDAIRAVNESSDGSLTVIEGRYRFKLTNQIGGPTGRQWFLRGSVDVTIDGTEPFIIHGVTGFPGEYSYRHPTIVPEFDAITNWLTVGVYDTEEHHATWQETYEWAEAKFKAHRAFADENDKEFIPHAYPGFDDRATSCNNSYRYIPHSPNYLTQLLDLADQYRTIDIINMVVWNDFYEMTAIQPGTYRGHDFVTDYHKVFEEFQQSDHPGPTV